MKKAKTLNNALSNIFILGKSKVIKLKEKTNTGSYYDYNKEITVFYKKPNALVGTETHTAVKNEPTDKDYNSHQVNNCVFKPLVDLLGTETITELKRETTDKDPSPKIIMKEGGRKYYDTLGTETITKCDSKEATDKD